MIPVGIVIQQNAALFEDTLPLLVRLHRLFQIPGQISCDNHIKHFIRKLQILRIHTAKVYFVRQFSSILFCFLQHCLCVIDCRHMIAGLCQYNRKKSRTGSDIQDFQILFFLFRDVSL